MSCTVKDKNIQIKTIHVSSAGSDESGDGSLDNPYASIDFAVGKIEPGTELIVHEGVYNQFEITSKASGTEDKPVTIRVANGEKATIQSLAGSETESGESYGIHIINTDNIVIEGFEIVGGTHGIYYESTPEYGKKTLENITISSCIVHAVRGMHGICVYARNDNAAVKNIKMCGCEVYDCECDSSESTVFNGNIEGFEIYDNIIHDNNNIGIDMIGFEGNAKHKQSNPLVNEYEVDYVRNGSCHDNIVYNISAEGNSAYLEDGEYDLCADGIYVDGGQEIDIYDNFIFNCDIGIEIATEHNPSKNDLFKVSGITVRDNVVAHCNGWCGLAFGGYDRNLGFTEYCEFYNNTFVDNATQIGVQRSRCNKIYNNLLVGSGGAIDYNYDCRECDLVNNFGSNVYCFDGMSSDENLQDYIDCGDYDLNKLLPPYNMSKQKILKDRKTVINNFTSLVEGVGSNYVPEDKYIEIYNSVISDGKQEE